MGSDQVSYAGAQDPQVVRDWTAQFNRARRETHPHQERPYPGMTHQDVVCRSAPRAMFLRKKEPSLDKEASLDSSLKQQGSRASCQEVYMVSAAMMVRT